MPQKLPADGFKWVKNISQFNEDFIKNYKEDSITFNQEALLKPIININTEL